MHGRSRMTTDHRIPTMPWYGGGSLEPLFYLTNGAPRVGNAQLFLQASPFVLPVPVYTYTAHVTAEDEWDRSSRCAYLAF